MPLTIAGYLFDMPDIVLFIVSIIVSAIVAVIIAHFYYTKQKKEAIEKEWSERLKNIPMDQDYRGFLVAVFNFKESLPLYAFLVWAGTTTDGKNFRRGSAAPSMFKLFNSKEPLLEQIHDSDTRYQDMKFGLTAVGKEYAGYLIEREIDKAEIIRPIDSTKSTQYFNEYGRLPGPTINIGRGIIAYPLPDDVNPLG